MAMVHHKPEVREEGCMVGDEGGVLREVSLSRHTSCMYILSPHAFTVVLFARLQGDLVVALIGHGAHASWIDFCFPETAVI